MLAADRLLVIGGQKGSKFCHSSVEQFDPATSVWTSKLPMSVGRCEFGTAVMSNGDILVCGGFEQDYGYNVLSSCELSNVTSETWTVKASLNVPRFGFFMTLMPSGNVTVFGIFAFQFDNTFTPLIA